VGDVILCKAKCFVLWKPFTSSCIGLHSVKTFPQDLGLSFESDENFAFFGSMNPPHLTTECVININNINNINRVVGEVGGGVEWVTMQGFKKKVGLFILNVQYTCVQFLFQERHISDIKVTSKNNNTTN